MSVPREIELKLEIDASADIRRARRALRSALPAGGEARRLVSRYFDTADHGLRGRGLTLRVRQDGTRRIQTLKLDGSGIFDRPEWESEIAGDEPDLGAVTDADRRRELSTVGPLAAVFETSVERTTWRMRRGRARIEVALDQGEVIAAGQISPIDELELELKAGSAEALFAIGRDLVASCPVKVGLRSKSDRGYALAKAGKARPGAAKAEPVTLDPDGETGHAFQTIARACIRHFALNEPQVVSARAPEALHQARVALRRLRSAFTLFKDVIAGPESERLKRELRTVSQALGEARNLDVYIARLRGEESEQDPLSAALLELRARAEGDRERAYGSTVRRLKSKRFRCLMIDLVAFVETGAWLTDEALAGPRREPIKAFSARTLTRRRRKVKRGGRRLARLDPEARHQVRIEAKKLRYASEFFESLVARKSDRKRWKGFVGALEELQSSLGDLNDLATGQEMALHLAEPPVDGTGADPALQGVPAGLDGGQADLRKAALVEAAAEAHRTFRHAEPFWR